MKLGSLLTVFSLISLHTLPPAQAEQILLQPPEAEVSHPLPSTHIPRIAIIGAGPAGSSAAYHLSLLFNQTYPDHVGTSPNLTIFDSNPRAGGRSTTIDALDLPDQSVELGASIFVQINRILYNTSREFELELNAAGLTTLRAGAGGFSMGVWDGADFVFKQPGQAGDDSGGGWDWRGYWDIVKLLWRYGLSPIRTQRAMKESTGRFLQMYEEPVFPFRSLNEAVEEVLLFEYTGINGTEVMSKEGISEKFAREIIQASTRVNYAQNVGQLHGLMPLVCMAIEGPVSVQGGNWRIFAEMVKRSGALTRWETTVTEVRKTQTGKYSVQTRHADDGTPGGFTTTTEDFDAVVLAAPYQLSNITFSPPLSCTLQKVDYVTLHVTYFTSPHRLSPSFFNLTSQNEVPNLVLTTLPGGIDMPPGSRGADAVGPSGFWSVNTLRQINVTGKRTQYLYKAFSPSKRTAGWVADLLGFEVDTSVSVQDSLDSLLGRGMDGDITWVHEKEWRSYPYVVVRDRGDCEEICFDREDREGGKEACGVWYTSGIEEFISTMETSALMGKNVAKLIIDGLAI